MTIGIEDLPMLLNDPERGLDMLVQDFQQQMLRRGVSINAIEGMTIALHMAYQLGGTAAAQEIARE